MTLRRWLSMLPLCAACGLVACGDQSDSAGDTPPSEGQSATISGEVFYRERKLLPPGAELEVQLQDISRADAPASVISSVILTPDSGPPYPFEIAYDPQSIDKRGRYALRATISRGEKLLFTSTDYIDPFAEGPLRILVVAVPARAVEPAAAAPADSGQASQTWVLDTLGGEPAPTGAGGMPIDLVLNHGDQSVSGFSGCNRYTGSFSTGGHSTHGTPLSFGPLAGTMRACVDGDAAERAYLKVLGTVDAYRMRGAELELLAGDSVVATFHMP